MKHLAEKFWELRGTFYGPVWDRVRLPGGKNVAYTDLVLWIYCKSFPFEFMTLNDSNTIDILNTHHAIRCCIACEIKLLAEPP